MLTASHRQGEPKPHIRRRSRVRRVGYIGKRLARYIVVSYMYYYRKLELELPGKRSTKEHDTQENNSHERRHTVEDEEEDSRQAE
jgi:hypothetical protein